MQNIFKQTSLNILKQLRYARCICFAVLLVLSLPLASFATDQTSIAEYVKIALRQNHEIKSAQSGWEAAREKIRQFGTLPDPKLGVEYFIESIETRTGPQEAAFSLSQAIPWPGRLSLEKKARKQETEIIREQYQATLLTVVRKVKEAFIEYSYLGQAKQITGQILELMQYLEGVARTNYTSGKASYTDILKIQVEIEKLKNKQHSFEDNTTPVRAQLNSLLGAERQAERPQPLLIPAISLSHGDEDFFALSRQNNPKIRFIEHGISRSRTDLDIANKGFYPDFSLSVKTILTGEAEFGDPPDSGNDPVMAGVAITLPLYYGKRNGAIAEKQAKVQAARAMFRQIVSDIESQVEMILFRYRDANRLQDLYQENLIPKVNQELEVTLEAYQNGQSSILELIDAEKNLLTFELASARAQADMAIQIARLEELTGSTLVDWN